MEQVVDPRPVCFLIRGRSAQGLLRGAQPVPGEDGPLCGAIRLRADADGALLRACGRLLALLVRGAVGMGPRDRLGLTTQIQPRGMSPVLPLLRLELLE